MLSKLCPIVFLQITFIYYIITVLIYTKTSMPKPKPRQEHSATTYFQHMIVSSSGAGYLHTNRNMKGGFHAIAAGDRFVYLSGSLRKQQRQRRRQRRQTKGLMRSTVALHVRYTFLVHFLAVFSFLENVNNNGEFFKFFVWN